VERIVMRPIGTPPSAACWNCGAVVDQSGVRAARYMYRADQPLAVLVEDWIACTCGAFQNLRCLNAISVETLGG
jgi:hypothetical protein